MRSSDSRSLLSSMKSQTRQRRNAVTNVVVGWSRLELTLMFYIKRMLERTGIRQKSDEPAQLNRSARDLYGVWWAIQPRQAGQIPSA